MSMTKMLGAAALLAVLCAPAASFATENAGDFARPFIHSESGCSRPYHYHYRAYRPRVHFMPRHNYPHKKKKPQIP